LDSESYKPMKSAMRKTIVILLMGLWIAILGASFYLDEDYYRTSPREPDPASGRIYPQFIHHGTKVYLTHVESLQLQLWWCPFMACMVSAYLLNRRWKCFPPAK
jgi:hypothetical protein